MIGRLLHRLKSWEGLLFGLLVIVLAINVTQVSNYLTTTNQINLFQLGIEKAIVSLAMAFVIISGEIDLSVASMMGLSAAMVAYLFEQGVSMEISIVAALLFGALLGAMNGFFVAVVGLNSLAVTLAGYIGFRGLARMLVEDKSVGGFPEWFNDLGQEGLIGPVTLSILIFAIMSVLGIVILHFSGFGRLTYVIGNSKDVARFSGVSVAKTKIMIFTASGFIAAMAGVLMAARLGAVRASTAEGDELDIITIVLLGGVSIFGGVGTMVGVLLSNYLVLNIRNGMIISGITGNTQTGVIGLMLILSVLIPNLVGRLQEKRRQRADAGVRAPPNPPDEREQTPAAAV